MIPFDMLTVIFVMLGLTIGSFGNVFLYRTARGEALTGRSRCPACGTTIRWYDLMPVVSYVVLRGRCRFCRKRISLRYPLVELLSAGLFALAITLHPDALLEAGLTAIALEALFVGCVFDALHQTIPDACSATIGVVGVVLMLLHRTFVSPIAGAGVGFAWFGAQWLASRGKAVGTGDVFLAAALGLWLGGVQTIVMLALSYMVGALVVLVLLALRMISLKNKRIAFGPFLGIGTLLALLHVGDAYVRMFF